MLMFTVKYVKVEKNYYEVLICFRSINQCIDQINHYMNYQHIWILLENITTNIKINMH